MKLGLETIRTMLDALGNPQRGYPSVAIAGTVGKGSVANILNSISTACGIRTGLYTSPHLVNVEERFVVERSIMRPQAFAHYFTRIVETVNQLELPHHPTYFEMLTAVTFLYFLEAGVELAILEAGLGGRLDSTNVTDPLLCVVTPVGLDHQQFLGRSLADIAREKAGILKQGRLALTAPQRPEVRKVLFEEASRKQVEIRELDRASMEYLDFKEGRYRFRYRDRVFNLRLRGWHQVQNAALAVEAFDSLQDHGFAASEYRIKKGVEEAECLARIQKLRDNPQVFVDGSHNLDSAKSLADFVSKHTAAPRSLLFGIMREKDISGVLDILTPCFERVYLTEVNSPRAATIADLQRLLPSGIPVPDPLTAYHQALGNCSTLVVAGSFYLAGEMLSRLSE